MALVGQRRAGHRRDRAAHRSRHRGRASRDALWARAHEIAAGSRPSRRSPPRARCGRSGSRSTGRTARRWSRASSTRASPTPMGMAEVPRTARRAPRRGSRWPADATSADSLAARIGEILAIDPGAPALEFEGRWYTWGELGSRPSMPSPRSSGPSGPEVGIILQNRPAHVGALLGVLRAGGCVVTINPKRRDRAHPRRHRAASTSTSSSAPRDDLAALVAERSGVTHDRDRRPRRPARRSSRTRRRDEAAADGRATTTSRCACSRAAPPVRPSASTSPTRRSSGCCSAPSTTRRTRRRTTRLRSGVAIVNSPLVHLGGLFRILQCVNDGRSIAPARALHGRRVVRRRAPPPPQARRRLVPTALRMVLDGRPRPDELSQPPIGGLRHRAARRPTTPTRSTTSTASRCSCPTPPPSSAAASRAGTSRTTPSTGATKRGSVGPGPPGLRAARRRRGRRRTSSAPDEVGLLEVKASQLGDDSGWMRTTDLARIDADGFLWILGRADQAIIRGGFKVRPDDVRAALEPHPAVRGAAVVGVADARLGAVPVARSSCATACERSPPTTTARLPRRAARPLRAPDGDRDRRRAAPHRLRQGRPRAACGPIFEPLESARD